MYFDIIIFYSNFDRNNLRKMKVFGYEITKQNKAIKTESIKSSDSGRMQKLTNDPSSWMINAFQNQQEKKYCSDTLLILYENVSQVNSIINYVAQKIGELNVKHYKYLSNGKKKWLGETELQKEIDRFNIRDAAVQFLVQGNTFLTKNKTPGFVVPTGLDIQPSNKMFVIPVHSLDQYGLPSTNYDNYLNPVIGYRKLIQNGALKSYQLDEIIHIRDTSASFYGRDFYYGTSRLYAATRSINVLANLYDTLNTILAAKGALGFLSRTSKAGELDPMMYQDLIDDLERRVNEDFGTTGNRRSIMATLADMKWNRMDSPVDEFLPIELTAQEFSQLCNQIGNIPDILFNSKSNATYNNMREAKKALYENCVIPVAKHIYSEISKDLKINLSGEWLEPDIEEIESLMEDQLLEAQQKQAKATYLIQLLDKKLITKNTVLEKMDMPTNSDPSFNEIIKPEPIQPPLIENNNDDGSTTE